MSRPSVEQIGLLSAEAWSLRATCARRKVGCVLFDRDGHVLATGYNGPASGQAHCTEHPCPGAGLPSGEGLHKCEAIHAEANALLRCSGVGRIATACVTHSPCLDCVKLLLNTGCRRIVFNHEYAHDQEARERWTREPYNTWATRQGGAAKYRTWEKWPTSSFIATTAEVERLVKETADNYIAALQKRELIP